MYHADIYDARHNPPSYWEATASRAKLTAAPLMQDESCDVAIIGGGFTGLSAALHLARDHGVSVRLLEAGDLAWGASGRNGGFCCLPAAKLSIAQLIERYGLAETQRFFRMQVEGMDLVSALAEDEAIQMDKTGDGNLEVAHHPKAMAGLRTTAEKMSSLFGIKTRIYTSEEFAEVGHAGTEQFGAMHMAAGFALHPLKFAIGLAEAAERRGALLHPHSKVMDWQKDPDGRHRLVTDGGTITAGKAIVATNGYTDEGLHPETDNCVLPVLSNIIVTAPLSDNLLGAERYQTTMPICNTRNLLFYYRLLPDKRFLIGARGDTTGTVENGQRKQDWMTRRLGELFPSWQGVEVDYYWRGLVCMTRKFTPSVGQFEDDPSVFYGYGYHANGVNTAPWVGRLLAQLATGKADVRQDIPAVMAGAPPRIPIAGLRPWYLRGALLYYRLSDALNG